MATQKKAAKSSTAKGKASTGFTAEERAAMKERAQELKAEARRANKADAEAAVLAKIAEMPEPDRSVGDRLHAIIKASAPVLSPKLWYGMPPTTPGNHLLGMSEREPRAPSGLTRRQEQLAIHQTSLIHCLAWQRRNRRRSSGCSAIRCDGNWSANSVAAIAV